MIQKKITKRLNMIFVAGLVAAAVISGRPVSPENYNMPVKKANFRLTEYITEGVEALDPSKAAESSQAAGTPDQGSTVTAGQAQGSNTAAAGQAQGSNTAAAGQAQGSNTAAAGQTQENSGSAGNGSNVVTAGSGKTGGNGPTTQAALVTEGEKGTQSEPILGGASITMLNSQTNSQMLSIIVETSQGSLIVVDGGLGDDGDYLLSQIQARGGHVSAWLLTHPHGDHAGALYKILQDGAQGITIDKIYYAMGDADWYRVHDPDEQTMAISLLGTFEGLPQDVLHQVSRNEFFEVDDVIIQVMNDRYELAEDTGNNAGIVYKMLINGKKVLFLGDLGEAAGKRLLADCGAEQLKADIVQMAHHGQNGVGEEVYQAINPDICLWPTPQWMWEHDGSQWKILETKSWMAKLGDLKHYVMKDGDQVIY